MATMQDHKAGKKAQKLGAAHVFGRPDLPLRPVAPESAGPDKDAEVKKRKVGAAQVFGRKKGGY